QLGYGASLAPSAVVVMSICAQSLYYMHVVLMFGCLLALLGRADAWLRRRVLWLTLSVVVVVCTIVTVATMDSSVAVRLAFRVGVRCAAAAFGYLICGVVLLRHGRRIARFGAQFAGYALLLHVVHLSVHAAVLLLGGLYEWASYLEGLEILSVCAIG